MTVAPPPPVSITSPANNSSVTVPGQLTISIDMFSLSATIAKVEIFDGAELLHTYIPDGQYNAITYSYNWYLASAGSHTLIAKVTDSQNLSTTSGAVTVQAVKAPSSTLTASGRYFVAPAYIDLYFGASAASGATLSKVEIFNGASLIATLTTPPFNFQWENVGTGSYSLTAKATDSLGVSATSAPVDIMVGAGPVIATPPGIDGTTVNDDRIQLAGTVQAPPNSAVTVNGILGIVTPDGRYFVNNVPLEAGSNTLTIEVATQEGVVATQSIVVGSIGRAPFEFSAHRDKGFGSLKTSFTLINRDENAVGRIELRCDEGAPVSVTAATVAEISDGPSCIYNTPGIYRARVDVFGPSDSIIYTASQTVYAASVLDVGRIVRGVYAGMLGRLKNGDTSGALSAFSDEHQPHYNEIFTVLGEDLQAAVAQFGSISRFNISDELVEVVIVRDVEGNAHSFLIYMVFGDDGIWRIESM